MAPFWIIASPNSSIYYKLLSQTLTFQKSCFICFNESPSKMMKNASYFILKAFFILKTFNFRSCRKNGLIRKISLMLKFMTSQPGQQTAAIHILSNISRSKGNQAIKFGQVTEDDTKIICLQKSCRKWVKETSSRSLFVF